MFNTILGAVLNALISGVVVLVIYYFTEKSAIRRERGEFFKTIYHLRDRFIYLKRKLPAPSRMVGEPLKEYKNSFLQEYSSLISEISLLHIFIGTLTNNPNFIQRLIFRELNLSPDKNELISHYTGLKSFIAEDKKYFIDFKDKDIIKFINTLEAILLCLGVSSFNKTDTFKDD